MSTSTRRQREKEERHQLILNAAEKIMQDHGLYGLNMDLVSRETELAKGTLYLYFKSKDEILATLSLKSRNLLLDELVEGTANIVSPIEQLKAIVMVNYNFFKKYPLYFELVSLYEINNQVKESEELQLSSLRITEFVVDIAERAKANGSLNPDIDPMQISICLWGMTVGMIQLIKVRGALIQQFQGIAETSILNSFLNILMSGIKK